MDRRSRVPAVMVALSLAVGCGERAPRPREVASKGGPSSKTVRLKGVVRRVDAGAGEVTISHEEIAGVMAKMTMPFTLENKAPLADVRPGDEVEGALEVKYEGGTVKGMDLLGLAVVRRPPPSPDLTSLSTGPAPQVLKPGDLVPDFTVTTQEGRPTRLGDLRGRVVVLTFIYTRCPLPEFCPAMDAKFADLSRRISAAPGRSELVRLLSISFDPAHDTPEVLAAHAARVGARPPLWTFAVASNPELDRVAGRFGLAYVPGTRDFSHNLRTAVIGPDGRLASLEVGPGWAPADLLKAAYALPFESGE